MQPLLRAGLQRRQMPRMLEIAIREAVGKARRLGRGDPGRRRTAGSGAGDAADIRGAAASPARRSCRHADDARRAWLRCSTRLSGSRSCAAAGCAGAHARAARARRAPQGADRPRDARQGACRMGQSLRRRHDRTDRLLLRLLRDEGLRRAADARDRTFPTGSSIRRARRRVAQVDIRPESRSGGRRAVDLGLVGDVGATIAALLPLLDGKTTARTSTRARKHYAKARKALDELARGHAGQATHPPAAGREGDQRTRRRRTRSSPAMSACRRSGRPAISR